MPETAGELMVEFRLGHSSARRKLEREREGVSVFNCGLRERIDVEESVLEEFFQKVFFEIRSSRKVTLQLRKHHKISRIV